MDKYQISSTATLNFYDSSNRESYYYEGSGNLSSSAYTYHSGTKPKLIYIKGNFDSIEDKCFSNVYLEGVYLRNGSYKHLGNCCFLSPNLQSIDIPETLQTIGHNNFSGKIQTFNIPHKIVDFPADNLKECHNLTSITVSKGNISYKVLDGVLYVFRSPKQPKLFRNNQT